ncbi:hypothetical protein O3P69_019793 [Scylla paramamosain]|uniref:Uncharacterized protein n=1 Tax=Scylla paramamosain TaxID=85552 RepID=A0AAW0SZ19_SCYPA
MCQGHQGESECGASGPGRASPQLNTANPATSPPCPIPSVTQHDLALLRSLLRASRPSCSSSSSSLGLVWLAVARVVAAAAAATTQPWPRAGNPPWQLKRLGGEHHLIPSTVRGCGAFPLCN